MGYQTVAFSQNPLFGPEYRLTDGFAEYHSLETISGSNREAHLTRRLGGSRFRMLSRAGRYLSKVRKPRILLDWMLQWIETAIASTPFFLMANISTAHYPWSPPPRLLLPYLGTKVRHLNDQNYVTLHPYPMNSGKRHFHDGHQEMWLRLYHAAVSHVDQLVGSFLKQLTRWAGWHNTIVIVTSDHGELLGDYRSIVGHTLSLTDKLIHIPLIIRHPDYQSGIVVEGMVQNHDLFSSVLTWAGYPTERLPRAQLQRPPLSRAISDPGAKDGIVFAEEDYTDSYDVLHGLKRANPQFDVETYPRQQVAVGSATHKYIWRGDHAPELFDMVADPDEAHNLLEAEGHQYGDILQGLNEALETWRSSLEIFPPQQVSDTANIDEATYERLQALGYLA
jgi:arylsulfatase A-like enzyme